MAGAVVGLIDKDSRSHPNFRIKLEAIGYGFLIPVFFVTSGLRLDLSGLVDNPSALARVPVFAVALLVVRGIPALLYSRLFDRRSVIAAGLLQATSLPFIVTATQIGVLTGTDERSHCGGDGLRRPAVSDRVPGLRPRTTPARPAAPADMTRCAITMRHETFGDGRVTVDPAVGRTGRVSSARLARGLSGRRRLALRW